MSIDQCINEFYKKYGINGDVFSEDKIFSIDKFIELSDNIIFFFFPNNIKVSGTYIRKLDLGNEYNFIYVNTKEPLGRNLFTIAHEFYHMHYEESIVGLCTTDNRHADDVEIRAEKFASKLLIPRDLMLKEFNDNGFDSRYHLTMKDIFNLQMKFNVTFIAILQAIDDLGKDPDYESYLSKIPKFQRNYYKYRNEKYWLELESESAKFSKNFRLNHRSNSKIMPKKLKENLYSNFKSNKIDYETKSMIDKFFEVGDSDDK